MKLVCVILREESPDQFTDTVELFDYGFQNFQVLNVSENEQKYHIESTGFLQIGNDVFGNSTPLLSIDTDSYVIIPNMVTFQDLDSTIDYEESDGNHIAEIEYSYHDMYVGKAYLNLATDNASNYEFDTNMTTTDVSVEKVESDAEESTQDTVFINIKKVLLVVLILAAIIITFLMIYALIMNNRAARRRENRVKRKKKGGLPCIWILMILIFN